MTPRNARRHEAHRGWDSTFTEFRREHKSAILRRIRQNYPDSSDSEASSWKRTVPLLQKEIGEVIDIDVGFRKFTAILEYELPMESRRSDAILLLHDGAVVIELKGKEFATEADIDQAHAYARDLRCYHRDCHARKIVPILVPERSKALDFKARGGSVHVCSPDRLDSLVAELSTRASPDPMDARSFLAADAYKPLPSLVEAARKLFLERKPPRIWRSVADTDDAVGSIRRIAMDAHRTKTRKLVLLTGVPGAGKTLVGLRVVHMPDLDCLASGDRGVTGLFLSGNGPLVEVLQHLLKTESGNGKTFVRHVKDYVKTYRTSSRIPPEHVIVFDEAQRAFDRNHVADVHGMSSSEVRSEPEYLIDFAERIPDWSVIVGLIGSGQEINMGEESGIDLWTKAIANSPSSRDWTIYGPSELQASFAQAKFRAAPSLSLNRTIRSHFASELHKFVSALVEDRPDAKSLNEMAARLQSDGHDLLITQDLDIAKSYLRDRYADAEHKRFGLIASSRDKRLPEAGVPNDFMSTKHMRVGPWYCDDEDRDDRRSCRHLEICITEYEAQGLELDAVLLAWGTDFVFSSGKWDISRARGYRPREHSAVMDPMRLRRNAYRVLLTRGRDAHVVFVPPFEELAETWELLRASGFRQLDRQD